MIQIERIIPLEEAERQYIKELEKVERAARSEYDEARVKLANYLECLEKKYSPETAQKLGQRISRNRFIDGYLVVGWP